MTSINITQSDQKLISEFSKLHMSNKENEAELKFYEEMKGKVEDCDDEFDMEFDENDENAVVHVKFGDCFLVTDLVQAKAINTAKGLEFEEEIKKLNTQTKVQRGRMGELKKKLYAKFGTAINLDD